MSKYIFFVYCYKEEQPPMSSKYKVRDLKKHTSKEIIKAIKEFPESRREWLLNKFSYAARRVKKGVHYKIWKDGFHPIELTTTEMIEQRLNYIHENPVKDEIVFKAEEYKFSSACLYAESVGVLDIIKL